MIKYEVNNLNELRERAKSLVDFLATAGVPLDYAFDSRLIISELVGNVLKHSRSVARMEAFVEGREIHLTVYAENGSLPPSVSVCSEVTAEGGKGLYLVDKLSMKRTVTLDGGVRVVIEF